MPVYYLDASAFIKRYRTEKGTEALNELFSGKAEAAIQARQHALRAADAVHLATAMRDGKPWWDSTPEC